MKKTIKYLTLCVLLLIGISNVKADEASDYFDDHTGTYYLFTGYNSRQTITVDSNGCVKYSGSSDTCGTVTMSGGVPTTVAFLDDELYSSTTITGAHATITFTWDETNEVFKNPTATFYNSYNYASGNTRKASGGISLKNTQLFIKYDETTTTTDDSGYVSLYNGSTLIGKYSNLQYAINAASNGYTIKLTGDITLTEGVLINGKNITIDGDNHTINRSGDIIAIAVSKTGTANLKNVVVKGTASNFEPDIDTALASVPSNSSYAKIPFLANGDTAVNNPLIYSIGALYTDNLTVQDGYSNGTGGLVAEEGILSIDNSHFLHNASSTSANASTGYGGALRVGPLRLDDPINITTSPMTSITIDNTEFKNNYSLRGGAITLIAMPENVTWNNLTFEHNTAYTNGGTIYVMNIHHGNSSHILTPITYNSAFPLPTLTIKNSNISYSYSGNDGYFIEHDDGALILDGCTFDHVSGVNSSQSVGLVSAQVGDWNTAYSNTDYTYHDLDKRIGALNEFKIDNCTFNYIGDLAKGQLFGDHGTSAQIKSFTNNVINNSSMMSGLFLGFPGVNVEHITINNSSFARGFVDQAGFNVAEELDDPNTWDPVDAAYYYNTLNKITVNDVVYNNTTGAIVNFRVFSAGYTIQFADLTINNASNTGDITFDYAYGTANGKSGKNTLGTISGNYDGNLVIGNYVINDDITSIASLPSAITVKYQTSFSYSDGGTAKNVFKVLTSEEQYTLQEIQTMLEYTPTDGKVLTWYTDSGYTTLWDGTISTRNVTLYGQEETIPTTIDSYKLKDNIILALSESNYEIGRATINLPSSLVYDGKVKTLTIQSDMSNFNPTITYKNANNEAITADQVVKAGNYTMIITIDNNNQLEYQFTITPVETNPSTGDYISSYIIMGIISIIMLFVSVIFIKNRHNLKININ